MTKIINHKGECMNIDLTGKEEILTEESLEELTTNLLKLRTLQNLQIAKRLIILPKMPKESCVTVYRLEGDIYINPIIHEYKFRHNYTFYQGKLTGKLYSPDSTKYTLGHISTFTPGEIGTTVFFTKYEAERKVTEIRTQALTLEAAEIFEAGSKCSNCSNSYLQPSGACLICPECGITTGCS